jgi:hypothetical protein
MSLHHNSVIYGERIGDLLPGLLVMRDAMTIDADGMCRASFRLSAKDGPPLKRALMRIEAELLCEDADSLDSKNSECRTEEQRTADALIRLFQAIR